MAIDFVFPQEAKVGDISQVTGGITKREFFAALAMHAFVGSIYSSEAGMSFLINTCKETGLGSDAAIVGLSIVHADALIARLAKEKK